MTTVLSAEGLALIQEYEGFRAEPTQLPDGNWVVGYGHVRIGEAGAAVSEAEAADLLALDLAPVERLVAVSVQHELTQPQFDALVSFAFSIGAEAFLKSQVLRRVIACEWVAAGCAMDAWRKSDVSGELEIVDALVRRRAAEKAMFLKGSPHDASPSVFMRAKLDHAASILGAPIKYAPAPVVGSVAVLAPKAEAGQRLTEILKSEPATEALLLTQVVAEDTSAEEAEEIYTAHAKPVARELNVATRSLDQARRALKEDGEAKRAAARDRYARLFKVNVSVESAGLTALLVFGLALIGFGAVTLLRQPVDAVGMMGAGAFAIPGLAAVAMAGFGLRRGVGAQAA